MKKIVILLTIPFLFAAMASHAQTVLYDQGGIRLTYTNNTLKSANCTEKGAPVYFVTARWVLSNYSGKSVYVNMGMNMYANGPATGCVDDDIIHFTYQSPGTSVKGVLKSGDSLTGEDGNWFLSETVTPWWYIRFQ